MNTTTSAFLVSVFGLALWVAVAWVVAPDLILWWLLFESGG